MKILIVGAVDGGSVSVGVAIYKAFVEIGQETRFLDFTDLSGDLSEAARTRDEDIGNRFLLKCFNRLLQTVLDFRPDAILGVAQSPLVNASLLAKLRKTGIKLCFWFVEDYRIFTYWQSYAPLFNHYFTIQKDPFWKELKEMGCNNYHYLPVGFDTGFSDEAHISEPDIDISFVGAPYPNRVHYFSLLQRKDFQIYGDKWHQHDNNSVAIGNRWIPNHETRAIYRRSLINLNLHSSMNPESFGEGDFVNPRTFELAGMGVFQLTDMRDLLPLHFDLNNEFVYLNSWKRMKSAIDYFLKNEGERKEIAKNAQMRVLKEHTYKDRAKEILSIIS